MNSVVQNDIVSGCLKTINQCLLTLGADKKIAYPKGGYYKRVGRRNITIYDTLGIDKIRWLVKHLYRKQAKKCHPDVGSEKCVDRFTKITEAYNRAKRILLNRERIR